MKRLADLLGSRKTKSGRGKRERNELVRYFLERARDREGKPYRAGYIAMRLSHLSVQDLYAFKSQLEDRARTFRPYVGRDGKEVSTFNWNAAFFGALKTDKGVDKGI